MPSVIRARRSRGIAQKKKRNTHTRGNNKERSNPKTSAKPLKRICLKSERKKQDERKIGARSKLDQTKKKGEKTQKRAKGRYFPKGAAVG